ncbi:hypothetical protein [Mesorhizobium sp. CAU 1732]|uniref:hypothetical protein n=1 Tax=Mesorhizobium sp. CAU 1732 TaxID=3140358 RepID=UPI0032600F9E
MKNESPVVRVTYLECCGVVSVVGQEDREREKAQNEVAIGQFAILGVLLLLIVPLLWLVR